MNCRWSWVMKSAGPFLTVPTRSKAKPLLFRRFCRAGNAISVKKEEVISAGVKRSALRAMLYAISHPVSRFDNPISSIKNPSTCNTQPATRNPSPLLPPIQRLDFGSIHRTIFQLRKLGYKFDILGLFKAGDAGADKFNQLPGFKRLFGF